MNSSISIRIVYLLLTLAIFSIPISIPLRIRTFQINFPVEPILVVVSILLFFGIGFRKLFYSTFFRHPLTLVCLLYHSYILVSIVVSIDPVVSAKYAIVSLCHFWVFYFGTYFLLVNKFNLDQIFKYFGLILTGVVAYSLVRFGLFHFKAEFIPEISRPFFSDHTLFSATMAFLLPIVFIHLKRTEVAGKWLIFLLTAILLIGLLFTFSRAAWLGLLVGVIGYFSILYFKPKPLLASGFLTTGILSIVFAFGILSLEKSDMQSNFRIFSNKDVSSLERLNRYSCAIRMWQDRPVLGFGIGTFQFAYLSYQLPQQMTRLSVTTSQRSDGEPHDSGKGGGAHSEYLQSLSELGLIGFIGWTSIVFLSILYCVKNYYHRKEIKTLFLSILIALIGYYFHAIFNNLLHDEEISFLFWCSLAIIAYFHSNKNEVTIT